MTDHPNESLEQRRARLAAELAVVRKEAAEETVRAGQSEESRRGFAQAMKLSSEFISAILVGAMLGYLLDRFAGTGPWGLIILLLLGFLAGILNVLRSIGVVAQPQTGKGGSNENTGGKDGA
jgi:ATP synthase protein I